MAAKDRQKPVNYLKKYVGIKEGGAEHQAILKVFNDSKLCGRYKMTTKDAWCATSVSAAFIASGLSNIFPCVECSCQNMIAKAKTAGIWVENDAFVPQTGDVILYDWDDNGVGDNTGWADHVGIVVSATKAKIKVIEGNYSNSVGYREINVNGKYIRGFITPKYNDSEQTESATTESKKIQNGPDKTVKATGVVTASWLNVRKLPGKDNDLCKTIGPFKKETKLNICDTVKDSKGADWYYIMYNGKYGYVNAEYIKKV